MALVSQHIYTYNVEGVKPMELKDIFNRAEFSKESTPVHHVLSSVTLIGFSRTRENKQQTFHFTFTYNEHTYILHHSFSFTWSNTKHSFRFSGPQYSTSPFKLSMYQLELLSDEFMKSVNEWNRTQPSYN